MFKKICLCLLVACLLSGCAALPSTQLYENQRLGVSLKQPGNWDLTFIERNSMILLEPRSGGPKNGSARIETEDVACSSDFRGFDSLEQEMDMEIDIIGRLYGLDSVPRVQGFSKTEHGAYEIAQATIEIPTPAMGDDSSRNMLGIAKPGISQPIVIFIITRDHGRYGIKAFFYKCNDEIINAQALEIINSIQFLCPGNP